jgi:hypothetical protein
LPNDLEIDTKIFMDGNISEANDILPFISAGLAARR